MSAWCWLLWAVVTIGNGLIWLGARRNLNRTVDLVEGLRTGENR